MFLAENNSINLMARGMCVTYKRLTANEQYLLFKTKFEEKGKNDEKFNLDINTPRSVSRLTLDMYGYWLYTRQCVSICG